MRSGAPVKAPEAYNSPRLIRTATVIPDNERWLYDNPQTLRDLEEGLAWAQAHPADDSTTEAYSGFVRLDLNSPAFQRELFALQKDDRHAAMETLQKLIRMTWDQVYRDHGLKWEKIASVTPPPGVSAVYSLRLTRSRRATAYRDGEVMKFISIPPGHDATHGKK